MGKVALITVGCKVNQSETDELAAELAALGHEVLADAAGADICVVHTCAVTAESGHKSRKAVRRALGAAGAVMATGCMVDAGGMPEMPGVALVARGERDSLARAIAAQLPEAVAAPAGAARRSRDFLKVQDGCDRRCSYCIVPFARGESRSREPDVVLRAAEKALRAGPRELVVTGVNLMRYRHGSWGLLELLGALAALPGLGRIRLSSLEPDRLTPEVVAQVLSLPGMAPHLHLPLQSGSDRVLGLMNRGYDGGRFAELVAAARAACPHVSITTDVIVGFPGEREEDVGGTVTMLEALRPARTHVFRYSRRPGTVAASMPEQVEPRAMSERARQVRSVGLSLQADFAAEQVGRRCEVALISGSGEEWRGLTENYVSVKTGGCRGAAAGQLRQAVITGAAGLCVTAECVG